MIAISFKKPVILSLSLVLVCFCLMGCGSQESPKEAAKEKAPPPSSAAPVVEAKTPNTATEYIGQGKEFLTVKQYDQAIASFSEAIKLDPKSVQAYNNRGIAYCNKGNFDQAISDFSHVIEIDPNNGKAYNNRAVAYLMKGEKDQARQDVDKAKALGIAVNPMLTDSLKGEASPDKKPLVEITPVPGPAPTTPEIPGKSPAAAKPEAPAKPEAKGNGETKKK